MSQSEELIDSPSTPELESMFKAGVHFAYKRTRRHPRMRSYIAGVRSNVEIFHLEKVFEQLRAAAETVKNLGFGKKLVLWVGTKPAASAFVAKIATTLGHPYVTGRWLGGTLTNFKVIRGRVNHMTALEEQRDRGELEKYRKHERMKKLEEIEKLNAIFGSLRPLTRIPDAMIVVDTNDEETAISEAKKMHVPTIGILNSDCDPARVTHPIPANDNAPKSIEYILEQLKNAYEEGTRNIPPATPSESTEGTPKTS